MPYRLAKARLLREEAWISFRTAGVVRAFW
jgi:hypothetical protein